MALALKIREGLMGSRGYFGTKGAWEKGLLSFGRWALKAFAGKIEISFGWNVGASYLCPPLFEKQAASESNPKGSKKTQKKDLAE